MRLFVAVDFPDEIKAQLMRLRTDIPTARWVGPEQMHITLFFLGDTERSAEVKTALAAVTALPFELSLTGVGRFPPGERRPPRVLWAGIAPQPALNQLQAQVSAALTDLDFEADEREFSPHVTLARLKTERSLPETTEFISAHESFRAGPVGVTAFALYSSQLTPQGARYRHEAVYPLKG